MRSKKGIPILIVLLLIGGSLILHYHKIFTAPNTTFMGGSVDGIKNYYTPWYHIKHDSSYTWFEGMNYPYGENLVFADAQPLFSNALRFISINIADISDYTVGILNMALFFSLFFTAWLLYLIFRRFRVEAIFAAVAASMIALLSPQMLKFTGHYALGYAFYVPLLFYLAIRYFEQYQLKFSLILAGTIFLISWVHPYYLMISAVFLTAMWLFQTLFQYRKLAWKYRIRDFAIQVFLPGLAFMLLLKLSDQITDRPANPYGFEEFFATWRTVFLPYAIPALSWFKQFQTELEKSWEGVAYIGVTGVAMFAFFWFRALRRVVLRFMGKRLPRHAFAWISLQPTMAISVGAGLLVLVFACGFPFSIKPEVMTDLFPPIKQFRSLGRFAWVFYYTWSVFAFYLVYIAYRAHRLRGRKIMAYAVLILPILLLFAEGYGYNASLARRINFVKAPKIAYDGLDSPWISSIEPGRYSALIALPFFHEGSENLSAQSSESLPQAFEASIKTGLPLMNVMMSRTSLAQSWTSFELAVEPYREPEIFAAMTDQRPVLGLRIGKRAVYDGPYLQARPPFVYEKGPNKLYPIDFRALANKFLSEKVRVPDTLYQRKNGYTTVQSGSPLFTDDFEATGGSAGYATGKGKSLALKDNNFLFSDTFPVQPGDTVILSAWVRLKGDRLGATMFGFQERDASDEADVSWSYPSLNKFIVAMDGPWALCEREVVVQSPEHRLLVNITRWKRKPSHLIVDDLMMRLKSAQVFRLKNGSPVSFNNRRIPLEVPDNLVILPQRSF